MKEPLRCPACLKGYSRDCPTCRNRTYSLTPLKILGEFPWPVHVLVWDGPLMTAMSCELCGKAILPEMTMRELTGPCSGGRVQNLELHP